MGAFASTLLLLTLIPPFALLVLLLMLLLLYDENKREAELDAAGGFSRLLVRKALLKATSSTAR